MQKLIISAALALTALPVSAADYTPPEGCEIFLTVQSKECSVSNLYRCDVAPEGTFWEASFSGEGLESIVSYDAQYQWIEAAYLWDQSREEFVPPAEDPIDVGALMSEGVDTFRFLMHRTEPGLSRDITVVGADVLTEQSVMIDGVDLRIVQTDLQILNDQGQIEYQSRGFQYFDQDERLFFSGLDEVYDPDGAVTEYDSSPVDFIHAGEAGFGATLPLYECNEQKASFDLERGRAG